MPYFLFRHHLFVSGNDDGDDATGVGTRKIPLRPPNVRADAEGYRRAGSPLPEAERRRLALEFPDLRLT